MCGDRVGENISKKLIIFAITLLFAIIISGAVSAAADIQVNQSVNKTNPNFNEAVKVTTKVTNNGPDTATGVQVTTKLPKGLIYVSDDSGGAYNPTTGIWNIGTFNYGDSPKLLNINTRVNATGTIKTQAAKTAQTNADSKLDNNSQKAVLTVPKAVDIRISHYLWYSAATYYYSNTPVFVVDVRNVGNLDDATNINVRYTIADGFEYIALNTRGVGTAAYNSTTRTITWNIPYMPKGAETTLYGTAFMNVYVRAIATGTKTPNLTNNAQLLSVDQYDYNSANNQASLAITVPEAHDIEVDQTFTRFANGGKSYVTYHIKATNNGPDNAVGVIIKDLLPVGLQWAYDDGGIAYNHTTGIWTVGDISRGTTKTLNITAEILATTGSIKNTAFLTAPLTPAFIDWNYNNNAKTTVITLSGTYTPNTDIRLYQYLWYSAATYYYSNTPVFVVDVRNRGNDDVSNVVVSYKIADGYEYITLNTRGVGTATYDNITRTITWNIPYMPKGAEATLGGTAFMNVYVRAIATGANTQNLTNTATLISPAYATPPTATLSITVPLAHDIEVNQSVTGTPKYNNKITINITATNNGPQDATGVTIKDLLPAGLQWVSDNSGGAYNATTGIWTIGNIANGATLTLSILVKVIGTGTIQNIAFLTAPLTPAFFDWNYDNNLQTLSIEVPEAADIAVTQAINNTAPTVNDTVSITVNVTNNGPDSATGINITDLLPSGLQFVSFSTLYGTYTNSNGIWFIENLLNGETATLTIIARAFTVGNYTNIANVISLTEYDWNTTNNMTSVNLAISGLIPDDIFTNEGQQGGTVNTDDGTTPAITLPFPITFYGHTYNTIYINVNGLISFGVPMPGPYYREYPDNVPYIAPFWGDIDITNAGSVFYVIENDKVTITWENVPGYTQTGYYNNFQVIMRSNGTFSFIYGDMEWANDLPSMYTKVIINSGFGTNPTKEFWNGGQSLSLIENKEIMFDSNGNLLYDPHIAVNYTVNNSTPNYHSNVEYTITATNQGPDTATGVKITSLLPAGLTFVSSSSAAYDSATGIWDVGALNVGESAILTIIAYVAQTGSITTYANVTAQDQYDPNPYESKNVTITVPNAADIAVTMTATDYTPTVGVDFDITIRVTNNGPDTATGVQVTDLFSSTGPLRYRSTRSISQGTYSSTTGIWNIGTLTSGQTATIVIRVRPRSGYQGQTVTNTATKTAETQYDPVTSNDSATITLNINP